MINLSITKIPKRLTQENDLSGLLVAKSSVRNYSTTSRNGSRIPRPPKCSQPQIEVEPRAYSSMGPKPLIEKKLSENTIMDITETQTVIPRPRNLRKLIHIHTSPNGFDRKPVTQITFDLFDLELPQIDSKVLFKGNRNLNPFDQVTIITFNVRINILKLLDKLTKPQCMKLINKIKEISIVVLLLGTYSQYHQITQTDYDQVVLLPSHNNKEILSYHKLQNQIFYSFKQVKEVKKYLIIDNITDKNYKESFYQKILIAHQCAEIVQLFVQSDKLNLLFNVLQWVYKHQILSNFEKLDLSTFIVDSLIENKRLVQLSKKLQQVDEIKQRIKLQHKFQPEIESITGDQRAEQLRDTMISRIKSLTSNKIPNMYFLIGDSIMRNIKFFRNQDDARFYQKRSVDQIMQITNLLNQKTHHHHINDAVQSKYAFYYLN